LLPKTADDKCKTKKIHTITKYVNAIFFTWVTGELTADTWSKYWGLIEPAIGHLNELLLKDYYLAGAKPTIIDFRVIEVFTRVHLINDKVF